jgi:hypothetical protein
MKEAAFGAAGFAVGMNAHSYARILEANDRLNFAIIGLHGRGIAHLECIRQNKNAMVSHVCNNGRIWEPMHTGTRERILLEVGSSTGLGSRIGFSRITVS